MVTVRFIGDEAREVSILPTGELRLVQPDATFDVPDEFAESYACQPHYFDVPGYAGPVEPPAVDVQLDGEQIEPTGEPAPNPNPNPEPVDKPAETTKKAGK